MFYVWKKKEFQHLIYSDPFQTITNPDSLRCRSPRFVVLRLLPSPRFVCSESGGLNSTSVSHLETQGALGFRQRVQISQTSYRRVAGRCTAFLA